MGREDTASPPRSQRRIAADLAWEGALAGLGDADAAARLRVRLAGPVPWLEVPAEAERLHLAPLFHLGLHAFPDLAATVPVSTAESLRQSARAAAARVAWLEHACAEVLAAASAAGIPVLVLKGLALGSLVYPSAAARPMDDVDLLVAEAERGRLAEILHGLGYRNDLRGEEDFYPPGLAYSIDVHTGLLNTTRIPARGAIWPARFEELWMRSQGFMVTGTPARTLGPDDTLMYLAVHAVHHHGLSGALWMADFLACLRVWSLTESQALEAPSAIRRSLWYCLEVLAAHGQEPVPSVRSAIRPARVLAAERWILAAIRQGDVPAAIRYAFTLACLPCRAVRAAFLRQLLFPRAGIYTEGFEDAGSSAPGRGVHWCQVMRSCRETLRAAASGRTRSGQRPIKPN